MGQLVSTLGGLAGTAIGGPAGGAIGSALGGAIGGGLLGSDSGSMATSQQTTTSTSPWSGLQPYLLGQGGTPATAATPGYWSGGGTTSPFGVDQTGLDQQSGLQQQASMQGTWVPGTPGSPGTAPTGGLFPSAAQWFASGGPQYYPGQTYAGLNPVQQQALASQYQRAALGSPLISTAQNQAQTTAGGQYLNAAPGSAALQNLANPSATIYSNPGFLNQSPIASGRMLNNPANAILSGLANPNMAIAGNQGTQLLQNTAQGGMLNANPYLDAMFNRAADPIARNFTQSVMPQIASMFSAAGRYGSNQQQEAGSTAQQNLGRTLGDLSTSIYGGNYANERGLQQAAQGQIGQNYLSGLGVMGQAAGLIGQNYNQGVNAMSNAAAQQSQAYLQGLGLGGQAAGMQNQAFANERNNMLQAANMAPGLAQQDYLDASMLGQVGAQQQANQQAQINADMARYNFGQNQPLANLQAYSQILQGFGGGQSTTQQQVPTNPLAGALGGAMAGNSLFNQFSNPFANQGAPIGYANPSLNLSGFGGFQPDMGYQAPRIGMF